jgi:hypothetical protein
MSDEHIGNGYFFRPMHFDPPLRVRLVDIDAQQPGCDNSIHTDKPDELAPVAAGESIP